LKLICKRIFNDSLTRKPTTAIRYYFSLWPYSLLVSPKTFLWTPCCNHWRWYIPHRSQPILPKVTGHIPSGSFIPVCWTCKAMHATEVGVCGSNPSRGVRNSCRCTARGKGAGVGNCWSLAFTPIPRHFDVPRIDPRSQLLSVAIGAADQVSSCDYTLGLNVGNRLEHLLP